ncbi:MAG TPA: STAS domain-containing protein [Polyangium sp.]|nr:STAS domain-containing protein [Polyangium sp.]
MVNERDIDDFDNRVTNILEGIAAATRGEYELRIPLVERDDALVEVEVAINMLIDELILLKSENETQRQEIEMQAMHLAERDRALVRTLSTPIIKVWPGVITLPLIGKIDEERQVVIAETLLRRVTNDNATHVILDVTGVSEADASMANALMSTARAVGLLGARTIITGVNPAVARALVDLNIHVDIPTMARLSDALALVFRDKQEERPASRPFGGKSKTTQ